MIQYDEDCFFSGLEHVGRTSHNLSLDHVLSQEICLTGPESRREVWIIFGTLLPVHHAGL